jgi:tripartite-type tricarboxylate transporter receptor subunit TctC
MTVLIGARVNLCLVLSLFSTAVMQSAAAQEASFFAGKKIALVIGFDVGGGYDLYARTVARHLSTHIPGHPIFVPQNMPGAGSRVAGNWLYNVAPKDGTAIGTLVQSSAIDQALQEPGIRFDAAKFNWIGNPTVDNLVTISWSTAGLATLDQVKSKGGLFCGGTGGGPTMMFPQIVNRLLGTRIKVVAGYPGLSAVNLAIERGEVNCVGGTTWSSIKATMRAALDERKIDILVQWGIAKDPEISAYARREVPLAQELVANALVQNEFDRGVLGFISSGAAMGRPLLAPPGVPPERVNTLRRAFDETMKDPAFLDDAARSNMEVKPLSGEALQRIAADAAQFPPDGLARAKELISLEGSR